MSDQQFSFEIRPFSHSFPLCPWTDHSDENALPLRFSHNELGFLLLVTAQAGPTLELCWLSPPPGPEPPTSVPSPTCQACSCLCALVLAVPSAWCCVSSALVFPRCRESFSAPRPTDLEGRAQRKEMHFGVRGVWFPPCAPLICRVALDLLFNCPALRFTYLTGGNSNTSSTGFSSALNAVIHEQGLVHSGCLVVAGWHHRGWAGISQLCSSTSPSEEQTGTGGNLTHQPRSGKAK